jgi:hypothetical protein
VRVLRLARLIIPIILLLGATSARGNEELVFSADEPFGLWINGRPVALAITTATIDHIILNDPVVQDLGLVSAPPDRIANLMIGGKIARVGRHGKGLVAFPDPLLRQELYWFPGASPLPVDGSVGPFALPASRVTVRWGRSETVAHAWPLTGGIDRAAYGVSKVGDRIFVFGADVRMRRPLPVVSASTGADLVDVLGGRLVGPSWQEEIMFGVHRPVRRLQLDRPLVIGPMSFNTVAVRVGGTPDGTQWLAPKQKPLPEADVDPAEMLVRGRTLVRRVVSRMIVLSRNHLEASGCIGLTVAKREQQFMLHCIAGGPALEPAIGPATVVATEAVPLLSPALPANRALPVPMMTDDGWLEIAADAPLAARILDVPVNLLPDSGLPPGIYLNEPTVARLPITQASFAGEMRRGDNAVPLMGMTGIGVHIAGRSAPLMLAWAPGSAATGDDLFDGIVDIAALPHRRVRVKLPGAQMEPVPLTLPMTKSSRMEAAGGDVRLSGVRRFVLHSRLREDLPLPVATPPLARELIARFGGRWEGPAQTARTSLGIPTWLRPMRLTQPLVIGPLRIEAVAVETDAAGLTPAGPRGGGGRPPRPALELSRRQLAEQGCSWLAIDQEARRWQIACTGPQSPPISSTVAVSGARP